MRRLDIHVDVLSCMDTLVLNTYFNTKISADYLLTEKFTHSYDAVMMPGGPKGTDRSCANSLVIDFIKRHIAIRQIHLCSMLFRCKSISSTSSSLKVVITALVINLLINMMMVIILTKMLLLMEIISAKGLGVSFEFAFTVAKYLLSDNVEKVDWQANHIYFKHWPLSYLD